MKKTKNKLKDRCRGLCKNKKLKTCFSASLFSVSIIYLCIGLYQHYLNNDTGLYHCISAVMMGIWLSSVPEAIKYKKVILHFIYFLLAFFIYSILLLHSNNTLLSSNRLLYMIKEILTAVGLVFLMASGFYVLYEVYYISKEILNSLITGDSKGAVFVKRLMSAIGAITSFLNATIGLANIFS